ncbi:acyl carrier protein [Streptomyces afghaniensis]|uniref:acyl carrier protein n=1 Tax=Streptomyces afghaniensis TaxID=66865 RepID=UPI0027826A22|nr:acyl carrier protein [Streptomyces afghaniensis]MDQ1015504.1 acyl carrier protein [Streptomyces afghaniensis]
MSSSSAQVSALLVNRFGVEADEIQAGTRMSDLDLDSLALVEFTLVAEQEFGVKLSDEEVSPENTVEEIAGLIDAKIAGDKALR